MRFTVTRISKTNKEHKPSLLTSMLLIVISALVVSISLTVILFSLMGRVVYGRVLANEMRSQARALAETTAGLFDGSVSPDNIRMMIRSSDTTVLVLDERKEPVLFSEPRGDEKKPDNGFPEGGDPPPEMPAPGPGGEQGMQPGDADKLNSYFEYCSGIYDKVMQAEKYSEYTDYPSNLGVIVALPVEGSSGAKTGAVFLIKPVNDIAETSKSLLIVLVMSAVIVALLLVFPIYLISKRLTNPVKKLNRIAGAFADGDLTGRVEPDGSREIGELGETFNELADNLERNISELTIERNRLSAVLDGLSEGLVAFDSEGSIIKNNSSAAVLLGGGPDSDIEELASFPTVLEAARTAMDTGISCIDAVNCGDRVIRVSAAPVDEAGGQAVGSVALLMDMTEAERLEQTRRDYVANVSHELRTPLASIRGIADMLNDGLVKTEEDKQRYYGYILKESIRLSTLINDLLELSRLQSGGVALKLRRVELYELIADAAERMSEPAQARGMTVDLRVPEGKYLAYSNPDRLEQVLVSLTDNAVKHGMPGGDIAISMEELEHKWSISVANPTDIEEKDLEHIFERFYKADTSHSGEGTGLGLAITEEVLHLMGESISAECRDGNITFTFTVSKYE